MAPIPGIPDRPVGAVNGGRAPQPSREEDAPPDDEDTMRNSGAHIEASSSTRSSTNMRWTISIAALDDPSESHDRVSSSSASQAGDIDEAARHGGGDDDENGRHDPRAAQHWGSGKTSPDLCGCVGFRDVAANALERSTLPCKRTSRREDGIVTMGTSAAAGADAMTQGFTKGGAVLV